MSLLLCLECHHFFHQETARLIAERYTGRDVVVVCPETAPIAISHALRIRGIKVRSTKRFLL